MDRNSFLKLLSKSSVEPIDSTFYFEGTSTFTLSTYSGLNCDGAVEYSVDNENWVEWDGSTTLSSTILYLRGTDNTYFATSTNNYTRFVFTTTGTISAHGRIDALLDYQTVNAGGEPTMSSYCYYRLFYNCTSLTTAPELPATTLTTYCYYSMFYGCTSLTTAPELPATTLANYCYAYMFDGCTSLVTAPELPATTLADYCYRQMFNGCTSLKVSDEQTGNYTTAWRIPTEGEISSTSTGWNTSMLSGTGGTFTDDPSINTTYYLDTTGG